MTERQRSRVQLPPEALEQFSEDNMTLQESTGKKIKEWILRYGPLEIVSIVCTLAGAYLGFAITHHEVAAAYTASIGGFLGYNIPLVIREILQDKQRKKQYAKKDVFKTIRNLIVEFTPAGVAITLAFRPAAILACTAVLGRTYGAIGGQILSNLLFYSITIPIYEWRKKHYK
jgi:hypothetical protein